MRKVFLLCMALLIAAAAAPESASAQTCYACFEGLTPTLYSHTFDGACGWGEEVLAPDGQAELGGDDDEECPLEDPIFAGFFWPPGGDSNDVTLHSGLRTGSCHGGHGPACWQTNEIYFSLMHAFEAEAGELVRELVAANEALTRVGDHLELVGCEGAFTLRIRPPEGLLAQID